MKHSTLADEDITVEEKVAAWHDGAGRDQELHEYLGWTWPEYKEWVATGRLPRARS